MHFDVETLTVTGAFVAFFASVLLAGAWIVLARSPALLWWSIGAFVQSAAIVLIVSGQASTQPATMLVGVGLATLSPALAWGGVRAFNGERAPLTLLFAGTVGWIAVTLLPFDTMVHAASGFLAPVGYLLGACYELWRRSERLPARWGLIGFLGLHGITFVGGVIDALTGRFDHPTLPGFDTWFGIINFESLVYSMGTALFMVLIVKEHSERKVVAASRIDSLTGIANRGALIEGGERLLQRCQHEGMSLSLVIFDIDHFKRVNDTYGHSAGDAVLRAFTETTHSLLRQGDLFGRYRGEEFVAILPRATIEAAYVIAERIRVTFASKSVAQLGVRCTVSAGVASAGSALTSLEDVIKSADRGLYRAKERGRNRVERPDGEGEPTETVIRIA